MEAIVWLDFMSRTVLCREVVSSVNRLTDGGRTSLNTEKEERLIRVRRAERHLTVIQLSTPIRLDNNQSNVRMSGARRSLFQ